MISDRNSHIILIDRLRTFSLQLKYHNAVSELYYFAFKAGFHADQPRVPRGSPDGGQWTLVGGKPWRLYPREPIDLQVEEARGGHAIERHVGKSEAYLLSRVLKTEIHFFIFEVRRDRFSSFKDLHSANYFTNLVLDAHTEELNKVRTGIKKDATFVSHFSEITGYQLYVTGTDENIFTGAVQIRTAMRSTNGVFVKVFRDNRNRNGFIVQTAFPIINDDYGND